jgi:2-keto-3-deoxy-6-phosphogluconate aldolase
MDERGKSFEHDPVKVIAEKGARNLGASLVLKPNTDRSVLPLTTNRGLIISPAAFTQATI